MYEEIKEKYPEIPVGRGIDLTNKKFGKLTALYRTNNRGKATYWVCKCDCGTIKPVDTGSLTSNRVKSCGCYQKIDKIDDYTASKIGTKIGKWTIIGRKAIENKTRKYWICECSCEHKTQKYVLRLSSLETSFGCQYCTTKKNAFKDLSGQHFGHWTVIQRGEGPTKNHTYWLCECDCENKTKRNIDAYHLKNGTSMSCGCDNRSQGEKRISNILKENNIDFIQEKTFEDFTGRSNNKYRFDFYINNSYLIEYDGIQHFKSLGGQWDTEERIERTKERDIIKNQWCKDNNIPLIRIPYTHLEDLKLEDLLLETSQFIVN